MCVTGLPSVVNMCLGKDENTYEGIPIADALRKLQAAGANVVGLNCHRGPRTMLPAIKAIRKSIQVLTLTSDFNLIQ